MTDKTDKTDQIDQIDQTHLIQTDRNGQASTFDDDSYIDALNDALTILTDDGTDETCDDFDPRLQIDLNIESIYQPPDFADSGVVEKNPDKINLLRFLNVTVDDFKDMAAELKQSNPCQHLGFIKQLEFIEHGGHIVDFDISYLERMSWSKSCTVRRLLACGFDEAHAAALIDTADINWRHNAIKTLKRLLDNRNLRRYGTSQKINWLEFEGFEHSIAVEAVEALQNYCVDQAVDFAKTKLRDCWQSSKTLTNHLQNLGFNEDDILKALDRLDIDWLAQAKRCWLDSSDQVKFSKKDLISEGFDPDIAAQAIDSHYIDRGQAVLKRAQRHLENDCFSPKTLKRQLQFEGIDDDFIEYAIESLHCNWIEQTFKKIITELDAGRPSKADILKEMKDQGYDINVAEIIIDNLDINWYDQVRIQAMSYLRNNSFSKPRLVTQLMYHGVEKELANDVVYALDVDWGEQALKQAQSYLSCFKFTEQRLIQQLIHEQHEKEDVIMAAKTCRDDCFNDADEVPILKR